MLRLVLARINNRHTRLITSTTPMVVPNPPSATADLNQVKKTTIRRRNAPRKAPTKQPPTISKQPKRGPHSKPVRAPAEEDDASSQEEEREISDAAEATGPTGETTQANRGRTFVCMELLTGQRGGFQ